MLVLLAWKREITDPGGVMKITIWLVTRERGTWITAAEVAALGLILLQGPGSIVRLLVGLPLLVHIGYKALTSLPMGAVPGRPERGQHRRHYDLRARIVRFLDEVRRWEDYAQRAEVAGWSEDQVEDDLRDAKQRVMAAAAEVAKLTGRSPVPANEAMKDVAARRHAGTRQDPFHTFNTASPQGHPTALH
jgi:hypothetical protein